jgi:hypothetical protein
MENQWRIITLALVTVLFTGCSKKTAEEENKECLITIDTTDFTFGIDYMSPDNYLVPGEQSEVDQPYLDEIRISIGDPVDSIGYILNVCEWINQQFSFINAGGGMIGQITVNELFELKEFYGCHSQALLISSVLRSFGFPAIMIETADVQWAYDYHSGKVDYFAGHVMSEIYVENNWILLDNNGFYVQDYDPLNPFIPEINYPPEAYFVFAKGIDTWDYSNKVQSFTHENLIFIAENIYCYEDLFHTITYVWSGY